MNTEYSNKQIIKTLHSYKLLQSVVTEISCHPLGFLYCKTIILHLLEIHLDYMLKHNYYITFTITIICREKHKEYACVCIYEKVTEGYECTI